MKQDDSDPEDEAYWLDRPKNISIIVWGLVGVCILLYFADAFYEKHPHFELERLFGFYGIYGFFVCVGLVLVAKSLRSVLMRSEEYYDVDE
jgi:hypothetical protein